MILRRIARHLKQQPWTGVFLDLVIVVLGVFIGIQVSNWNAAREDALLGQDYIRRLTIDLNNDLTSVDQQAAYYDQVLQAVKRTDRLLQVSDPDPKTLVINAYRSTEVIYTPPIDATWKQIVSSGHLELLPQKALEDGPDYGLSFYYSFDTAGDIYKILNYSPYRIRVREIIPMTIQEAMRAGCSDVSGKSGFVIGFMKTCTLDVSAKLLRSTATALKDDPEVARTLRYQYSEVYSAVANMKATRIVINRALSALADSTKAHAGAGI